MTFRRYIELLERRLSSIEQQRRELEQETYRLFRGPNEASDAQWERYHKEPHRWRRPSQPYVWTDWRRFGRVGRHGMKGRGNKMLPINVI